MRMVIHIDEFPLELLDGLTKQLAIYAPCEIEVVGNGIEVSCSADLVHLMEVLAITELYSMSRSVRVSNP